MRRVNTKQYKTNHNRMYYIKWLLNQYREHKLMVLFLFFMTALSTVIIVAFPMVFKYALDTMVASLSKYQEGKISLDFAKSERNKMLVLLLAMGLGPFFSGVYTYFRAKMNITFEMYFREKFFKEILKKNHGFFLKFRTGDLVTRLTEDIKTNPPGLSWLCCSGIFRSVNSLTIIFFCFLSMLFLHSKLALVAAIPLPIILLIFMKLEQSFGISFKEMQEGVSEGNDFLEASYSGIKIISSFNSQSPQKNLFADLMKKRIKQEMRVDTLWGFFMVFFEFLNYAGEIIVLTYGGYLVIKGELTLGAYYAFFSYLGMIVFPLMDIPMLLVTLTQTFVVIDRLEALAENEPQIILDCTEKANIDSINKIELENVSFKHQSFESADLEDDAFSFDNISFSISRGEKIAVVGQIGSGKTTLLNIISGVFIPNSGCVKINGKPLSEINISSYRDKLGYIQQEPVVFSETIATNIDFWRGHSQALIEACSKIAQFDTEVLAFPGGYCEAVGQRGSTLSGGQRQRLSIARALTGSPQLLLMDDITASLDASNEKKLWQDLADYNKNITSVIVTHRLSTAAMADKIIVLSNGGIEAVGDHLQLLQTSETYKKLAST